MIDTSGNGFNLTSLANGVRFDINGDGVIDRISWTAPGVDDAWLCLDRNGNGIIDDGRELFGDAAPQPATTEQNGFLALSEFDRSVNGGNGDGVITNSDSIFSSLRLWEDVNHNGLSEPNELKSLYQVGLTGIELRYKISRHMDRFGNRFRYRSKVRDTNGNQVGHWAWDVFLLVAR